MGSCGLAAAVSIVIGGLIACGRDDTRGDKPVPMAVGAHASTAGTLDLSVRSEVVPIAVEGDTLRFDRGPVSVGQFAAFVAASKYVTQAEAFGNSGVFDVEAQGWTLIDGAFWRQPFGKTGGDAPVDHPVTHVSYYDAQAYCRYYEKRLPTAAEWEAAARAGQPPGTTQYPWGDSIKSGGGLYRANVWQGLFPVVRHIEDGYLYTSPIGAYGPHPSGLTDMAGNVWEWVQDTIGGVRVPGDDTHHLAKGGSFLCEPGWCHGYLITGATHNSAETGLFHTGFRCVCDNE